MENLRNQEAFDTMAMLDRYKKPGGFTQLVALLETCGPSKREKFMELIRQEDSNWAQALGTKLLDLDRIFKWDDQILMEIFGTIQDMTAAVIVKTSDEDLQSRIFGFLSAAQKRRIQDLMETSSPNAAEVTTLQMKFMQDVRKMAQDGKLRFEKIDPSLVIESDIEDLLNRAASGETATVLDFKADSKIESKTESETPASASSPEERRDVATSADDKLRLAEINVLKKKMVEMQKEIVILRRELNVAKGKLDQIKKIA